jgi:DNA invertase Pin-like site-specific DNA recombinase
VEFRSLQEQVDATAPGGRLAFSVFAALAHFERGLVHEHTFRRAGRRRPSPRPQGRPAGGDTEPVGLARQVYHRAELWQPGFHRPHSHARITAV